MGSGREQVGDQVDDRSGAGRRRLSVAEAAEALGVSMEAVRGRIKRNTIEHERIDDRVYVLVDAAQVRPGQDQGADRATDQEPTKLVESLQDQVEYLREQLQRADERDRENRRIIAALTQRIPAIEAPVTSSEEPDSAEPRSRTEGEQEGAEQPQRRSWWREFFGFE